MSKKKKEEPTEEAEAPATDESGEVIEGAPKKGKKKLIIIIGAVVLLAAIGAGVFFSGILGGAKDKDKKDDAKTAEEPAKDAEGKPIVNTPTYYELPQFLVNLEGAGGRPSFLKMSVTLELRDKAAVATMDANKPRVIDAFNTYLRELRPVDIQGSAGIYRLRNELMTRLNSTIEEGVVKDILFGEIIVQ